jgi:hypothetical protein
MALTIGEAQDVNTLLNHYLQQSRNGLDVPGAEAACEAAARLADKANKALSAGLSGEQVRELWPTTAQ